MSLTGLFRVPTWKDTMRALAPPIDSGTWVTRSGEQESRPVRVVETPEMSSHSASLIGTAFDYYARHRLARRRGMTAAEVPLDDLRFAAMVSMTSVWGEVGDFNWPLGFEVEVLTPPEDMCPDATARFRRWDELMRLRARYLDGVSMTDEDVAAFCFFLARLDVRYRAGAYRDDLPEPEQSPAPEELAGFIQCMESFELDLDLLDPGGNMTLGPSFGAWSAVLGGADGDLLVGDTMIEIKTTARADREKDHRAQVVAYALLAEASGLRSELKSVAIYYTRFRAMVRYDLQAWRATPEGMAATEAFVAKVRQLVPEQKPARRQPTTRAQRPSRAKSRTARTRSAARTKVAKQAGAMATRNTTETVRATIPAEVRTPQRQSRRKRIAEVAWETAGTLGSALAKVLQRAIDRRRSE